MKKAWLVLWKRARWGILERFVKIREVVEDEKGYRGKAETTFLIRGLMNRSKM